MTKPSDMGSVGPEKAVELARERPSSNGIGNLLKVIDDDVAGAIAERIAERDGLVAKVLELNDQIVQLQTHQQVATKNSGAR